ncbi:MAG TPA: hypothetical protein VIZ43_08475 [Trebonia sp.]
MARLREGHDYHGLAAYPDSCNRCLREKQSGAESFTYANLSQRPLGARYRYLAARLKEDRPRSDTQAHAVAAMLEIMADLADREDTGDH